MSSTLSRNALEAAYAEYAREYLHSLPLEHFMEATAQGTQREITLESLALVKARRPDFQVFNELLVQYPREGRRPGQVVPDNMVVRWSEPIQAEGSFDMPLQPTGPFWVLEYVSKSNKRKDYVDNFRHYEKALQVPYYLVFYPDNQDLRLYRMSEETCRYVLVSPNENKRYAVPDVEIEVGLLDGWVRFWYQGKLLPLPAELLHRLDQMEQKLDKTTQQLDERTQQLDQATQERDLARQERDEATRQLEKLQQELQALRAQNKTNPPPG